MMEGFESDSDIKAMISYCKTLGQEYKTAIEQMKRLLTRLHTNPGNSQRLNVVVQKLNAIQEHYQVKDLNEISLMSAQAEQWRQTSDRKYMLDTQENNLKTCLKLEKMLEDLLNSVARELNSDMTCIAVNEEILTTKLSKIKIYKRELDKLNKSGPALGDLNLSNISKEMKKLDKLRDQNRALHKDVECYGGLKPDLDESSKQLAAIKLEYEQLIAENS